MVASGDTGYFAFNERLVSELDLSGRSQGGDVFVGAGFFDADAAETATTAYHDFQIWSLAGVSLEGAQAPPIQLEAASFDRLVQAAESKEPLAGPESGVLQPQVGSATVQAAGVDVENFVARVAFVNPSDDTESPWDVGLAFREQDNGDHYRLTIDVRRDLGIQDRSAARSNTGLDLVPQYATRGGQYDRVGRRRGRRRVRRQWTVHLSTRRLRAAWF